VEKLNRRANEMTPAGGGLFGTVMVQGAGFGTLLARSKLETVSRSGNKVGKYFRINSADHVGA
jgi:hypothetical protein